MRIMGKIEILKKYLQHAGIVLFVVLAVLISVPGVYTGFKWVAKGKAYRHFDSAKAVDMLQYLKEVNPSLYLLIISPEDSTQRKAMEEMFTTEGDKETVALGYIIMISSILALVVILLSAFLLFQVLSIKKKLSDGDGVSARTARDEPGSSPGPQTEQIKKTGTAPKSASSGPIEEAEETTIAAGESIDHGPLDASEESETLEAVA